MQGLLDLGSNVCNGLLRMYNKFEGERMSRKVFSEVLVFHWKYVTIFKNFIKEVICENVQNAVDNPTPALYIEGECQT